MNEIRLGEFPLQFGLFDWIDWEAQRPYSNIFEERLQMLEYADQESFFCYHLAGPHRKLSAGDLRLEAAEESRYLQCISP
jgi:hypothetical protein